MKIWLTLYHKDTVISSEAWVILEIAEPTGTVLDKALMAMAAGEITAIEIEKEEEE